MTAFPGAYKRLLQDGDVQVRFAQPHPVVAPAAPQPWSLSGWGPAMFWTVVTLIALSIMVVLVQFAWRRRLPLQRRPRSHGLPVPVADLPGHSSAGLSDGDALARQGRYSEAVHALLLHVIHAVRLRFPRLVQPAHTGRDIASLSPLPGDLRHALSGIVMSSEYAVFAERPIGQAEWVACRALVPEALAAEMLAPAAPGPP